MLLSFSIQNCYSFLEEATLDLAPTPRLSWHRDHVLGKRGARAMRLALLFGTNGAGKTNLLRALALAIRAVLGNSCEVFAENRFLLAEDALPTKATFRFLAEHHVYRYTFETDGHVVLSETLHLEHTKGTTTLVFSRDTNGKIAIGDPLLGRTRASDEVLANPQRSGAEWYRWRTLEPSRFWLQKLEEDGLRGIDVPGRAHLLAVLDFLRGFVFLSGSENDIFGAPQYLFANGEGFRDFLKDLLHWADIGISDVIQEELAPNETQRLMAKYEVPTPSPNCPTPNVFLVCDLANKRYLSFRQKMSGEPLVAYELKGVHNGLAFPLRKESAGTLRLLNLSSAIWMAMQQEKVFVVDEFDAFLHPLLAKHLLGELAKHMKGHAQLLMASHCVTLLTTELLRPDEVWMVEKRGSGASDLYSLARFMPRSDKRLEKGYLAGLYGAVPSPGEFFAGDTK